MGEFADYALQETEEMENDRWGYRMGLIGHADAYDRGIIDELGFEVSARTGNGLVTCRHCGKLCRWKHTSFGWRTGEMDGSLHICPVFRK